MAPARSPQLSHLVLLADQAGVHEASQIAQAGATGSGEPVLGAAAVLALIHSRQYLTTIDPRLNLPNSFSVLAVPQSDPSEKEFWVKKSFVIMGSPRIYHDLYCVYSPRNFTARFVFADASGEFGPTIRRSAYIEGFRDFSSPGSIEDLRDHYRAMMSHGFCRASPPDMTKASFLSDGAKIQEKEKDESQEDCVVLKPFSHLNDNWEYDALK